MEYIFQKVAAYGQFGVYYSMVLPNFSMTDFGHVGFCSCKFVLVMILITYRIRSISNI